MLSQLKVRSAPVFVETMTTADGEVRHDYACVCWKTVEDWIWSSSLSLSRGKSAHGRETLVSVCGQRCQMFQSRKWMVHRRPQFWRLATVSASGSSTTASSKKYQRARGSSWKAARQSSGRRSLTIFLRRRNVQEGEWKPVELAPLLLSMMNHR